MFLSDFSIKRPIAMIVIIIAIPRTDGFGENSRMRAAP